MKFFVLLILAALYVEIYSGRLCMMKHKRYQCKPDGSCMMVKVCWPRKDSYITHDLCKSKCGKKSGACTTCAPCAQTAEKATTCTNCGKATTTTSCAGCEKKSSPCIDCEKVTETAVPTTTPVLPVERRLTREGY